jgi:RNA polymerase sigma-70 factor (ECF subfamily)
MSIRIGALRRLRSDPYRPGNGYGVLEETRAPTADQAHEDTARLIERAKAGDRDAFGTLYKRHYSPIYRLARFYVESADEVASETFLRAWAALPRYRPRQGPFAAWLYGIAARVISDACVTQLRRDNDDGVDRSANDGSTPIATLVSRLPKEQRQVVEMKYLLALNDIEVAAYLDRSATAVNAMHWQAISSLRMMEIDP